MALLTTPSKFRLKFLAAVAAELVGTFLFALFGGAAPAGSAALANGIALVICVYATANVSGGHLNPAVTVATIISGHISALRGLLYIVAQLAGASLASLAHVFLISGASDVGCFHAAEGTTMGQVFGWELLATFTLVAVVYAAAVGKPDFGTNAPLAIGLSLYAAAVTMGGATGGSLNPARAFGPALVFGCYWSQFPVYLAAELVGGALAALVSIPLYGSGADLGKWIDSAAHPAPKFEGYAALDTEEAA